MSNKPLSLEDVQDIDTKTSVLVACEVSQAVTNALRNTGIEAYSCDLLSWKDIAPVIEKMKARGITENLPDHEFNPKWHIQGDVTELLREQWAAVIAHPPCRDITKACAHVWGKKQRDGSQQKAVDFFMKCYNANSNLIAIENPPGFINSNIIKPTQIVHPYNFGHAVRKMTCLWLRGFPHLLPTGIKRTGLSVLYGNKLWDSEQKIIAKRFSHKDREVVRAFTYPGIAEAMAKQWGQIIKKQIEVNHE